MSVASVLVPIFLMLLREASVLVPILHRGTENGQKPSSHTSSDSESGGPRGPKPQSTLVTRITLSSINTTITPIAPPPDLLETLSDGSYTLTYSLLSLP